jgi:hypothetical protein
MSNVSYISPHFRSPVLCSPYPVHGGGSTVHAKEPTTEFRITAVCTITDPAERQRRLMQVYRLIMNSGQQKRVAVRATPEVSGQPTD